MNLEIQKQFIDWYFNEQFPHGTQKNRSSFLASHVTDNNGLSQDTLRYWLEQAFHQGARVQKSLEKQYVEK